MTGELIPHHLPSAQVALGPIDRMRANRAAKDTELDTLNTLNAGYRREVARVVDHNAAITEAHRTAQRGEVGMILSSDIYDVLVNLSAGDQAKAEFLAPLAMQTRDNIRRLQ